MRAPPFPPDQMPPDVRALHDDMAKSAEQMKGFVSRREDEWLNAFIDKVRDDGELEKLSQKWIGQPLPALPTSLEGVPFTVG